MCRIIKAMTAETLDAARERLRPYVERARDFTGWINFPSARKLDPLPWDYSERARELLTSLSVPPSPRKEKGLGREAHPRVLDIGTGGAERFAALLEHSGRPSSSTGRGLGRGVRAVATEEWPTNVPVAAATLTPLGGQVVHCQDELLPFAPNSFDLILNRHSALDPADIARILKHGGTVLTQQVGNDNWDDIRPYFPQKTDWGDHYTRYREGFRANGLTILGDRRHKTPAAFDSLGDFVYCLCVANWEAPGLDPLGKDLETLLQMERDLTTPEGLVVTETRYILEAHKPA